MKGLKLLLVPLLVVASAPVFAAAGTAVDVSDVTGTILAQLPSISAVGEGVLAVLVAVMAFKWVRRAM